MTVINEMSLDPESTFIANKYLNGDYLNDDRSPNGMLLGVDVQKALYRHGDNIHEIYTRIMPCGHAAKFMVSADEGTNHCMMCELERCRDAFDGAQSSGQLGE